MAVKMIEKFEKYWDVIHGVMVVATILDPSSDGPTHVKSEYDAYLEENVLPRTKDFDIWVWWRANARKFSKAPAVCDTSFQEENKNVEEVCE
ncbi:hypothetical protein Ddye_004066 [Dipteronia dyeriana]|uniref:DUF4413 domain-containing protein n=1 Tax=Dipteronia dyeriana TaxID=168575 RepID=A0AAD9XUL8_9ROSI|nr:hypothetical protein Ddye_004066 [Dipteronia dyeriana]